jgi:predicted lipid-binding transport protein (Tim44 family)
MMKKLLKIASSIIISASLILTSVPSYAKRFGSGKSYGRQNTTAIQRAQDPANTPSMPTKNSQQNQPYQQQPQNKSRFGGFAALAGGIAAGLGLAWLASKMGLGAEFGNIMLILAVVLIAFMLFRLYKQKKLNQSFAGGYNPNNSNSSNNTQSTNYSMNNPNSMANSTPNSGNNYTPYNTTAPIPNNYTQNQNTNTSNLYPQEIMDLVNQGNFWFTNVQTLSDEKNVTELRKLLSQELLANIEEDFKNSSIMSKTVTKDLQSNLLDWRETNYEWLATLQYKAFISEDGGNFVPVNEAWTFTKDKNSTQGWKLDGISQLNN